MDMDVGEGLVHKAATSPISGSLIAIPLVLAIIEGHEVALAGVERSVVDKERLG